MEMMTEPGNGSAVAELLSSAAVDAGFAADVLSARDAVELDLHTWPDD
ncbi:hypothetical protein SAMN04489806_2123 [Paramicrobacterium humi]|uniref:Uncharacterized protein n=1 Tax=Paramicrobacterium humi TaxID=640635 RepID=A0A1H4N947_9MICO|nr:hypothetical protein [Microbacterium humi]SEB91831.1 hypothetical protein SAMN04489806_2123 [Microbacterium humi]